MRDSNWAFIETLRAHVGRRHVLTEMASTKRFRSGFRAGEGQAIAVVRVGTLVQLWRVLKACIAADKIIIMQAANTGLTGGSTPDSGGYDRDAVIINTLRIATIHPMNDGRQVICLPGSTLSQLERTLARFGREPHSVIGSSCIGASVIGGVCNNSGGSLVSRGPAFTQMALFGRLSAEGRFDLVNHLGIELGAEPERMLEALDQGHFDRRATACHRAGSDHDYCAHVRDLDANTPARFNADPRRLFEASGSAGKIAVFAVRLDTFPAQGKSRVFYIGTNQPAELTRNRRDILRSFRHLPVSAEYMHRDCFDIAATYGKDVYLAIRFLGASRLPHLLAMTAWLDSLTRCWWAKEGVCDHVLQFVAGLLPNHLPRRQRDFRDRFEHHLILKTSGAGTDEARAYLRDVYPSVNGAFFECTDREGGAALRHRFAAAGAGVRYRAVHREEVEDIVALDVALRRNDAEWITPIPATSTDAVLHALYYGHFLCNVFHQDYVLKKGADAETFKRQMLECFDEKAAEYPAEHNVGHLYVAKPAAAAFYRDLDPINAFNPGIGQLTKAMNWGGVSLDPQRS